MARGSTPRPVSTPSLARLPGSRPSRYRRRPWRAWGGAFPHCYHSLVRVQRGRQILSACGTRPHAPPRHKKWQTSRLPPPAPGPWSQPPPARPLDDTPEGGWGVVGWDGGTRLHPAGCRCGGMLSLLCPRRDGPSRRSCAAAHPRRPCKARSVRRDGGAAPPPRRDDFLRAAATPSAGLLARSAYSLSQIPTRMFEGFLSFLAISPHSSICFRHFLKMLEKAWTEFRRSATRPCFPDFQFIFNIPISI